MAWFDLDILDFFAELEVNNERAWFEKNKKRYESSVRKPMETLAGELIGQLQVVDPTIDMIPKDAVFRIYRDIRFSKDKTPYKTNAGLYISASGKSHSGRPGIYFHVDARSMGIASGYYNPEPAQVRAIRTHIGANLGQFADLLEEVEFKSLFGTIAGEKGKVLPAELRAAAADQPILFNKQFYYWHEFDGSEILRDDLPDLVFRHYLAAQPMNSFLTQALSSLTASL